MQSLDHCVRVIGCILDVGPIEDGRNTRINRSQGTDQIAPVAVLASLHSSNHSPDIGPPKGAELLINGDDAPVLEKNPIESHTVSPLRTSYSLQPNVLECNEALLMQKR